MMISRYFKPLITGASLMCLATTAAYAGDKTTWFGDKTASGAWIIGVKSGAMINEQTGVNKVSNNGIVVGYMFTKPLPGNSTAAIEFEFTDNYKDGDFDASSFLGTSGTWQVESKALYLAFRTAGTVYFKGKAGATISETTYNTSAATITTEDSAASVGGGIGFRLTDKANVELEYTGSIGNNDINFVSLGASFNF